MGRGSRRKVYAHKRAGLETCLGDGYARLDGEGAASEGHDGHNGGLGAREELIGRALRPWWAAGAIQHVYGVLDGIVPEGGGSGGRGEVGTRQLH
eukprot:3115259-Pleurochrysis_carterae.AAC.1